MKLLLTVMLATSNLLLSPVFAKDMGNSSGGGGDASEARVNEIRADLLNWINQGGAKNLTLPSEISYETYVAKMKKILKSQYVVISFTKNDIIVDREEKTCKNFYESNSIPKIICNIERFAQTPEAHQYSLIHHEYAGLVKIEDNQKGASDYEISNQLTGFLEEQVVLKLVVKEPYSLPEVKREIIKDVVICSAQCQDESLETYGHDLAKVGVIHYAPVSEKSLYNSRYCLSQSKSVVVYGNRKTDYSSKTCVNALSGKYFGKIVEIDTDKKAKEDDEGTYFSIKIKK